MYVINKQGEREEFDPEKIKRACERAQCPPETHEELVRQFIKKPRRSIKTRDIHSFIYKHLLRTNPPVAARFSLKRAMLTLGPSGFIFEKIVRRVFQEHGHQAELPPPIKGLCVMHEVDVRIKDPSGDIMAECKYHNREGIYCGIKTTLYVWARFLDLKDGEQQNTHPYHFIKPLLVSNTRFSEDSIAFSRCKNMDLLGWKYPHGASLEQLLESKKLYPITVLNLDKFSMMRFFYKELLFTRDLCNTSIDSLQRITGIDAQKLQKYQQVARELDK